MSIPASQNSETGAGASPEGHEYHIVWAAKVALRLIYPNTDLTAKMQPYQRCDVMECYNMVLKN